MHFVKDSLAKLLAQEDLAVEHRSVETAQFNVETRVLSLPIWQTDIKIVDAMIAHEVGHALYTPNDWSFEGRIPMQFVNVVEDIRVEKLMKRRYGGISKTFFKGYSELHNQDFFSINGKNVSGMNLADRLNLHYKIGAFVKIPFSAEEAIFVERAKFIESFEDALDLAEDLYKFCKDFAEKQQQQQQEAPTQGSPDGTGEDQVVSEGISDPEPKMQPGEGNEEVGEGEDEELEDEGLDYDDHTVGQKPSEDDSLDSGLEVETQKSMSDALQDVAKKTQNEYEEYQYLEAPKVDYKKFIVPNKEVWHHCEEVWNERGYVAENFAICDTDFKTFKQSSNQEVNYLVKEFECRKSADAYARATTSRTGVLDTTKLHTYRYNEDLFKKVTNLQEGKNHTLIFNLDWSGSMGDCLLATVKQLISLVSFCRKVNIEYRVYAFTDGWRQSLLAGDFNLEADKLWIHPDFALLELLRSDTNNSTHERQVRSLYRVAYAMDRGKYPRFTIPRKFALSGTPLNECVLGMFDIAPMVKKETKCQKLHIINLTDGEGNPMYCSKKVSYRDGETHILRRPIHNHCVLRDRKCGKTYKFHESAYRQTETYVQNFRDRFPEIEIISIRLLPARDWKRFANYYIDWEHRPDADTQWKKNKNYIDTHTDYSISYIIKTEAIDSSTEFDVSDDASKAQIRNAFKKSLGGKKANKQILSSFIKQIA